MEAAMADANTGNDKTRIQQSSSPVKAIPDRYQASVVILKGYAEGMSYDIEKTSAVIGRDAELEIPLKDPLVSRQHAVILFHDNAFHLKDLGSTNGTVMNGVTIKQAELHHGDKFQVGNTVLQFILEDTGRTPTYEIG
jgi:pSer/pThr/pTyr-binding forkhead associated (FHA) protein